MKKRGEYGHGSTALKTVKVSMLNLNWLYADGKCFLDLVKILN